MLLSERMLKQSPHLTPNHVMMHTNGFAFIAVLLGMFATGEAAVAPWGSLPWFRLFVYGACSWVGVCCFIALTREWGATVAVIATNARKLLTVALSFILFPTHRSCPLSRQLCRQCHRADGGTVSAPGHPALSQ